MGTYRLEGHRVGVKAGKCRLRHFVQALHIFRSNSKREDIKVLLLVNNVQGLGNRKKSVLQAPTKSYLTGTDVIFLCQFLHQRILEKQTTSHRTPGLNGNAVRIAEVNGMELRITRVKFQLIHHGLDTRTSQ